MIVVNVRTHSCTHYIGRGSFGSGINTNLGNSATITRERDRDTVVKFFEDWVRNDPGFVAQGYRERIKALPENAVLGCWCKPLACHGDVIVKLWKEMHP